MLKFTYTVMIGKRNYHIIFIGTIVYTVLLADGKVTLPIMFSRLVETGKDYVTEPMLTCRK